LGRTALAGPGVKGANERLVVGHIAVGGRGNSLLRRTLESKDFDVAALCDVDAERLGKAKEKTSAGTDTYRDYRKILDRKDIDAVVVATPDHWHALPTIGACEAGKDVYCEKPLSQNLVEGRRMIEAARKHGRIVQTGTQHRTEDDIREVCEIIRSGRVGKIHHVEMWMWENPYFKLSAGSAPPAHLDWDRWLGPAPMVEYHEKRCHFNFRWFRDYAGGYMTDWGAHMINVVSFAMDTDRVHPVRIEGSETPYVDSLYEYPEFQQVTWYYEKPNFKMTWTEPGPKGESSRYGMRFHGTEGVVDALFGKYRVLRDGKVSKNEPKPGSQPGDVALPRTAGNLQNWFDCIKSRELPINDVEVGHYNAAACHLGNIASQLGRTLPWDPTAERFIDDEQADAMRLRPYRAPWKMA
jgi:predicted dehydrogenase